MGPKSKLPLTIERIQGAAAEVAERNGALKAVLFGSYARGTATPDSDVDIIFVEETSLPFLKRLERYIDPLVDRLGTWVEAMVYTPAEFERMTSFGFVRKAVAEGVVLYERGKV